MDHARKEGGKEGGREEGREQGTWNKGLRERSSAMTHPTDHMSIAARVRFF
jgi:hypothetical protein